jgi:enoyl-CoA hydratase/carnithine racemase
MSSASYPVGFPSSDKAFVRLERVSQSPDIFVIRMLQVDTPDNRLTPQFLSAYLQALDHVEKVWNDLDNQKPGAALITTGMTEDSSKFFSNGLDLKYVMEDARFFDKYLNRVYEKLLSFPIPTIASVGGHCFAAAFGLAMAHDYRVFNGQRGFMCMNEIDFGAQIPPGLYAALASKLLPHVVMRKMVLEGHRFGAEEALSIGMVDLIEPKAQDADKKNGAAKTLEASLKMAKALSPKAGADAYQSNKLVMHAPFIATLREE